MTETQFRAEMQYQAAIALAKTLLKKGLLTPDEYAAMDAILLDKFQPWPWGLRPRGRLRKCCARNQRRALYRPGKTAPQLKKAAPHSNAVLMPSP